MVRKDGIKEYITELASILPKLPNNNIKDLVELLMKACKNKNQVFIMGNGGNGCTASHFVNDIEKYTVVSDTKNEVVADKNRIRAMCLNDNTATVTAWTNDISFDICFSEQLKNWVQEGDIVIGISASGNSKNVLNAFEVAKQHNAITVCLSAGDGGKAKDIADLSVIVPSKHNTIVEDIHLIILHLCVNLVRDIIQKGE